MSEAWLTDSNPRYPDPQSDRTSLPNNPKPLCHLYFSSKRALCKGTHTVACFHRETRYSGTQNGSVDEVEIVNVTSIDMYPDASRLTKRCFLSSLFKSPCPLVLSVRRWSPDLAATGPEVSGFPFPFFPRGRTSFISEISEKNFLTPCLGSLIKKDVCPLMAGGRTQATAAPAVRRERLDTTQRTVLGFFMRRRIRDRTPGIVLHQAIPLAVTAAAPEAIGNGQGCRVFWWYRVLADQFQPSGHPPPGTTS